MGLKLRARLFIYTSQLLSTLLKQVVRAHGLAQRDGPRPSGEGFRRQHSWWVGSYSSSPHPHSWGNRLALWGPVEHLFPPLLGNARQPRNPRSRHLAPLPGGVGPWALHPSPRATPALTILPSTPQAPNPCLSWPLRVPNKAGPSLAVSRAGSRGISPPRGCTKRGVQRRLRRAPSREPAERARPPPPLAPHPSPRSAIRGAAYASRQAYGAPAAGEVRCPAPVKLL